MGRRPEHYIVVIAIFLIIHVTLTNADGRLAYGDKCSVQNAIIRVFSNADVDESEKCNSDQGLICTGTCTCPPTRVWYRGPIFGLFGGGSCVVGANGPCTKTDRCVENAMCGDNIPLCFCNDGYHAHDLQCISSHGHNHASGPCKMAWSTYGMLILIVVKVFTS